jgi:hypothetical protein
VVAHSFLIYRLLRDAQEMSPLPLEHAVVEVKQKVEDLSSKSSNLRTIPSTHGGSMID